MKAQSFRIEDRAQALGLSDIERTTATWIRSGRVTIWIVYRDGKAPSEAHVARRPDYAGRMFFDTGEGPRLAQWNFDELRFGQLHPIHQLAADSLEALMTAAREILAFATCGSDWGDGLYPSEDHQDAIRSEAHYVDADSGEMAFHVEPGGWPAEGPTSEGSLRANDIGPRLTRALLEIDHFGIGAEPLSHEDRDRLRTLSDTPAGYDWSDDTIDDLANLAELVCPAGYTWGASEGDGASFGFWPSNEASALRGRPCPGSEGEDE